MRILKNIGLFAAGAVVGILIGYWYCIREFSRFDMAEVDRCTTPRVKAHVSEYYDETNRIPIPDGLDFSTNAWQQLTLWQSFARHFSDYRGYGQDLQGVSTDVTYPSPVACGGRITDEWRVEANRELDGAVLAKKAALMLKEGRSFDFVKAWVTTNYSRMDSARSHWINYAKDPTKGAAQF